MPRDYFIKFDTEGRNALRAVKVSMNSVIETDMSKRFAINLSDDPLYPALCEYVKNNPPHEAN